MHVRHLWFAVVGLQLVGLCISTESNAEPTAQLRSTRDLGLMDSEVADVFSIGDITFIYREDNVDFELVNPVDLQSVADAIRSGLPNSSIQALINKTLEGEHKYYCADVNIEGGGGRLGVWHITYQILRAIGGSSGVPFQYRSYVRPDGTRIEPELVLCNEFEFDLFEPERTLYCVLPFAQFRNEEEKEKADEEKVQSAAKASLRTCLTTNKLTSEFRDIRTTHLSFPANLVGGNDADPPVTVWAVEFVESSTPKEDEPHVRSFRIWVTEDLKVGKLSYGTWSTEAEDEK